MTKSKFKFLLKYGISALVIFFLAMGVGRVIPAAAQAGILDHVTVTPASATLVPGGAQQFTAQAFDIANNPVAGATFLWNMASGGGTISPAGLFTAGTTQGTFTNTVQAFAVQGAVIKFGSASVTVTAPAPGPLDHVTVSPASATVALGGTQQFTAQGFDAANTPITGLGFTWNVAAGGGTINAGGLFTAGITSGSFLNTVQAVAVQGAIIKIGTASVTITVAPGPLDHVVVSPASAILAVSGTQQFTAQGFDVANVSIPGLSFSWSVVAGGGGINAGGLFTAGSISGSFLNTVQAVAVQGAIIKIGIASVTITAAPGPLDHVVVSPASALLAVNGTQQFTAQGFDAANVSIPGLGFGWNVVAGGGTINASGLFTAGITSGSFLNTVQAVAVQGAIIKIGSASVTVTVAPIPVPRPEKLAAKKILRLVDSSIDTVGFEHFLGAQWSVKENGQTRIVKAIPGVVNALSETSITLLPNGQTDTQVFTFTSLTRMLSKLDRLQVGDKAVVATVDGVTSLVIPIPIRGVSDLDKEDRSGPNRGKDDDGDDDEDEDVRDQLKELKKGSNEQLKDMRDAVRDQVKELRGDLRDQQKEGRQGSNRGRD